MNLMIPILLALIVLTQTACTPEPQPAMAPVKVEVILTESGYRLMRGGQPYQIRGAGMPIDDIERFAAHGGNSIRNWTTDDVGQDIQALLDNAQHHGVTVALCLPMRAERHGMDYDDAEAVAAQLESFRDIILRYRDHPALLFWIIGNELNHNYTNPAVYDAVNDVAAMIHDLDPNHPVTTTLAGVFDDDVREVESRAPQLDFLSFQVYGMLFALPGLLGEIGYEGPFMVTEWGAIGYWEMEATTWGAPIELTSSEKADVFLRGHREVLETLDQQLLGSYVFLWGQKQERTPTWFGMFTDQGEPTEAVDVMYFLWNGAWPVNRTPRVDSIRLDGRTARDSVVLDAGEIYEAAFGVRDPEGGRLRYRWEVKPESDANQTGGDFERSVGNLDGALSDPGAENSMLTAPGPGDYRLFAYAYDDNTRVAHANIPFHVPGAEPAAYGQTPEDLLANEIMGVAYSGFREGQHPDRGDGAVNPSDEEILEDLELLVAHGFRLIRMYDSGENTRRTLELISKHDLPIRALLGIWLDAEVSNHEGCPWLHEPIPNDVLAANTARNSAEIERGIELASRFESLVVAVNVGNEALVEWNDHMVPVERVIGYVRTVRGAISQPVTVADNYLWWIRHGKALAAEVDFLGVHSYPQWEGKSIDDALAFTIENIDGVSRALPGKPIAVLEAGWATVASEFGIRASEDYQVRYYDELRRWAADSNTTVFFFEAFDEPWKGDPNNPDGAEKHWGLFNLDRTPKQALD
jgi:exo-beta-1,3-glucanase (GH17 family)